MQAGRSRAVQLSADRGYVARPTSQAKGGVVASPCQGGRTASKRASRVADGPLFGARNELGEARVSVKRAEVGIIVNLRYGPWRQMIDRLPKK